jgi:RHS repeat-associated protein
LDYAVNRYYWVGTGRFMSPDPYMANSGGAGGVGDPGSWNRYSYVGGDPVNWVDPGGLFQSAVNLPGTGAGPSTPLDGSFVSGIAMGFYMALGNVWMESDQGWGQEDVGSGNPLASLEAWSQSLDRKLRQGLPEPCNAALAKLDAVKTPNRTGSISATGLQVALGRATFKNGVGSTDLYMALFPGRNAPSPGLANMTVGDYFATHTGTSALAALGGNTIYFRPGFHTSATIMHELLHNLGLEDDDIMKTLGLTGPSREITNFLWDNCLKPPLYLLP